MKVTMLMRYMNNVGGSELQMETLSSDLSNFYNITWWTTKIDFSKFPKIKNLRTHLVSEKAIKFFKYYWIIDCFAFLYRTKPDIVYSRDPGRIWVYSYICKILSIKFVWSLNYSLNHVDFSFYSLVKNMGKEFVLNRKITYWRMSSYLNNKHLKSLNIIAQTPEQKNLLHSKNINSELIYNSVKIPVIGEKNQKFTIAFVGNLGSRRRPEIFLDLCGDMNDLDINFVMCGRKAIDTSLQKKLEKRIGKLKNLQYLGEVPQNEVNKILSKSHLMIYTPKQSGLGNVILESWACKTPVVSIGTDLSQITGNSEISLSCKNYQDLFNCVKNLSSDVKRVEVLGDLSRKFVSNNFSQDTIANKHKAFFNKILHV